MITLTCQGSFTLCTAKMQATYTHKHTHTPLTQKLLDTRASVTAVLPAVGNKKNWIQAKTIRLSAGAQLKAEAVHSLTALPRGDR